MIAAMNGQEDIVKYLTSHGANQGIEDIEGKTAREYAIEALESAKSAAASKSIDIKT